LPISLPNGKLKPMNLRIDKLGRVVVPKAIRDRLGLVPDAELEVHEHADGLLLRLPKQQAAMAKVKGLWVHQGVAAPGLNWERTVTEARGERLNALSRV
jgi:AbrB family looped-hinge helix DNA binding protein